MRGAVLCQAMLSASYVLSSSSSEWFHPPDWAVTLPHEWQLRLEDRESNRNPYNNPSCLHSPFMFYLQCLWSISSNENIQTENGIPIDSMTLCYALGKSPNGLLLVKMLTTSRSMAFFYSHDREMDASRTFPSFLTTFHPHPREFFLIQKAYTCLIFFVSMKLWVINLL